MKTRVTQIDVARVAQVHNTTVSLALRNCPSIPESTRIRIRKIADQLGYTPDPALQALVAYRKGLMTNRLKDTLAYVTNWDTRWGWRTSASHEKTYLGAHRKAADLGYHLEHFWLSEPGMSQRRLSSMLYHRNITGALIASHEEEGDSLLEMDWARLSAVKIGCFPHAPALHQISDGHSGNTRLAVRRILAAGYKRIGLVMAQWWDGFTDQACSAGYFTEQNQLPAYARIPVLRLAGTRQEWMSGRSIQPCSNEVSALARWYHTYRPEVIIGFSPDVLSLVKKLGLSVPQDVGYVDLCLDCSDHAVAGIRQNSENTGEVAVSMLVEQIQQNSFGIPKVATSTLVGGSWCEGATLPPLPLPERSEDEPLIASGYASEDLPVTV